MFTRPVFVFRTWQHTECLMWNCKEFLAFDCESIWPDFEFWKHHVVDYFCGFSLQIKLCNSPFLPVCVCCAAFCRLISEHPSLSFRCDLQLTSGAADLCIAALLCSFQESFKALQRQQMANARTALIHFLRSCFVGPRPLFRWVWITCLTEIVHLLQSFECSRGTKV